MSGFHQKELQENSRDITSFSTNDGSYRFKSLPYGIKIAPNSFQRMMTIPFSGLKPEKQMQEKLLVEHFYVKNPMANVYR